MKNYIGDNIKYLRLKNKKTQSELAERLYTKKQNIYKYEKGIITPPVENLMQIAEYFGVPIEDLIRTKLSKLMDAVIELDHKTILKYSNVSVKDIMSSHYAYKFENKIYFENLLINNVIIDFQDSSPYIEYLDINKEYNKSNFLDLLSNNYSRNLHSGIVHYTDIFLRIDELDIIANSLGTEIDYKNKPGNISVKTSNDFLAFVKLLAHADTNNSLTFDFNGTFLSMINSFWDETLSLEGYELILNKLNKILFDKFGELFDQEKIEGNFDEHHFYGFLLLIDLDKEKSLEQLYEKFNSEFLSKFTFLRKLFLENLIDQINQDIFGDVLKVNIKYNYIGNRIINNGFDSQIVKEIKSNEANAYYNYLIGQYLDSEEYKMKWKEYLAKYLLDLNLGVSLEHIIDSKSKLKFYSNVSFSQYNDYLESSWLIANKGYTDSKTVQLIKYYITQEIKKKL